MRTIEKVAFKYKNWFEMKQKFMAIPFSLSWQVSHNYSLKPVLWQDGKYSHVLDLALEAYYYATPMKTFVDESYVKFFLRMSHSLEYIYLMLLGPFIAY